MENSCFYKIRFLGGPESLKSATLNGKQLFLLNQVFRRSRELKIGNFGRRKQLFLLNQVFRKFRELKIGNFGWKTAFFNKIRCLGGVERPKSAILAVFVKSGV